jgi:hypothetical protein
MNSSKRPLSVTIIGCIFVAIGIIATAVHGAELKGQAPVQQDVVWAVLVSLVALVCGIYMLRRSDWARWLAMAWLAFHVLLSIHSRQELVVHSALFAVFAYFLFRTEARAYFRPARTEGT